MNLKTQNFWIGIAIFAAGIYVGSYQGKITGKSDYIATLADSMQIYSCDGSGCKINLPDAPMYYAVCEDGYSCSKIPMTEEIKKHEEMVEKITNEIMQEIFPSNKNQTDAFKRIP